MVYFYAMFLMYDFVSLRLEMKMWTTFKVVDATSHVTFFLLHLCYISLAPAAVEFARVKESV